ncbi:MAG TPA: LysR family transcriptional regulator [Oceanospirillaceae bacterium]|nr:LysR family transcriptional regulator [Oceanospirillaceae bacterium]
MITTNRLKNLDLGTLRSFATIAEAGSMTRAAARLFMTQSAISMQIKRLEASLGLVLFERTAKGMVTTSTGEQLLGYAIRLLDLNDEAVGRLTSQDYEGQVRLGIPSDVIYPYMPDILKQFNRDYPRVQIKLSCANSKELKQQLKQGSLDVILATEKNPDGGGEVIGTQRLIWTGADGGNAWKQQPLPLGMSKSCAFWPSAIKALDSAGLEWIDQVTTEDFTAAEAMTAADLCVCVELGCALITGRAPIDHGGLLPALPDYFLVVYCADDTPSVTVSELMGYLQRGFA